MFGKLKVDRGKILVVVQHLFLVSRRQLHPGLRRKLDLDVGELRPERHIEVTKVGQPTGLFKIPHLPPHLTLPHQQERIHQEHLEVSPHIEKLQFTGDTSPIR